MFLHYMYANNNENFISENCLVLLVYPLKTYQVVFLMGRVRPIIGITNFSLRAEGAKRHKEHIQCYSLELKD